MPELRLSFNLRAATVRLNLEATLPADYPDALPRLCLRSASLSSAQTGALQAALAAFLADEHPRGEPCLWPAVEHLTERAADMAAAAEAGAGAGPDAAGEAGGSDEGRQLQREFVYFHHIYNKQKRRDIVGWGRELNLSGFSVIGKPGLVCAEGAEADVREYLQRLRRLPWQKIQSKVRARGVVQ